MKKLDKQNYPETRQAVAQIVLDRFSGDISQDLKTVLEKIVSLGYYQINDVVNNSDPLFEGVFSKEKLDEIGKEYFRFARKIFRESGDEIIPETYKKIGEKGVLDRHNLIANFSTGNIKNLSPSERFEIAKIHAKSKPKDLSFSINHYCLTQEQRFEVAKIAIDYDPFWVIARIHDYKLTQEQRFKIAKLSTTKYISDIYPLDTLYSYIKMFRLTQEQEFETVLLLIKNPNNSYRSVVFFDKVLSLGFSTNQLFELVKSLLFYDISVVSYLSQLRFSRIQELEIVKRALTINIQALTRLYFIEKNLNYKETVDNAEGFLMIIEASFGNMEELGLFSQEKLDILKHQGKYQRYENLKYLFIELLGFDDLDFSKFENNCPSDLEQRKKILFLSSFGFSEDFIKYFLNNNNISQTTFEDFCTYAIRIKNILGKGFFERLNIDFSLLDDKKLSLLINFLKTVSHISQTINPSHLEPENLTASLIFTVNDFTSKKYNISEVQNSVKNDFSGLLSGLASPILQEDGDKILALNNENIGFITENLNEIFLTFLKLVFKINGEGISMENIENLESIWGNLEVLFVLISRFSSKKDWFQEIPILSKLVEILLNSSEEGFRNYKYFGTGGTQEDEELSRRQLSGLEGESLKSWLSNPSSIKYINTKNEGKISDEELLKIGQGEFLGQLLRQRHLDQILPGIVDSVDSFEEKNFENEILFLKNSIKSNVRPKDLLKGFASLNENKNLKKKELGQKILLIFSYLARKTENFKEFKYIIDFLKLGIEGVDLGQIQNDLKSISGKIAPIESGEETIIFTTIFDDPKLLLEIGDLVNTFSCQNYRIGEWIQTLLGYVIDANIKGVLSFSINPGDLGSKEKFDELKEKINSGDYSLFFDAPKRILKIDNTEIQLGRAINRRILRVGSLDENPVMFAEQEYSSTHFAGKYISNEVENMIDGFAEKVGLKRTFIGDKANFFQSKNPGGVYVDALGGIFDEDYKI